jgi:hypothetical protein
MKVKLAFLYPAVALFLCLCTYLHWIPQKQGFHIDEALSLIFSECKFDLVPQLNEHNGSYSGKELKKRLWSPENSAYSDICQLRNDNKDQPHTNMYYSILRLCLVGADGSDERDLINRGCGLNIIFAMFSFFFLYRLLKSLYCDEQVIAVTLLAAFICASSLSNLLFIRPYKLQETLFIALTYVFVKIYRTIESGNIKYKYKEILVFAFLLALVLLSGYFAIGYVALLGGVLLLRCVQKKQPMRPLMAAFTLSLFVVLLIYPKYFDGFFCYRASEIYAGLFGAENSGGGLLKTCCKAIEQLFSNFLAPFFLIILIPLFKISLNKASISDKIILIVLACATIWLIVVFYIAPYKDYRYIMAVFPIFALIFPFIMERINGIRCRSAVVYLTGTVYLITAFVQPTADELFTNFFVKKLLNQRIRFLYRDRDRFPVGRKPQLPVFICNSKSGYFWFSSAVFFCNEQEYFFIDPKKPLPEKLLKYKHAFVITDKSAKLNIFDFDLLKNYKIVLHYNLHYKEYNSELVNVYEIERNPC